MSEGATSTAALSRWRALVAQSQRLAPAIRGPRRASAASRLRRAKKRKCGARAFPAHVDGRASARSARAGEAFPCYFIAPSYRCGTPRRDGPWTLEIGGMVRAPLRLTLADLMRLPRHDAAREPLLRRGLDGGGGVHRRPPRTGRRGGRRLPAAQYVDFQSFDDGYHESWDLESAMHPQTLIVYGKDGALLARHTAPRPAYIRRSSSATRTPSI